MQSRIVLPCLYQIQSMASSNMLARDILTAKVLAANRTVGEPQQVRAANRNQAAVQGLIDSAWRDASIRLLPNELAKTKALVDPGTERCEARPVFTRTQSRKARK